MLKQLVSGISRVRTFTQYQRPVSAGLVPYVIEQSPKGGERAMDIFSRLLKDRIICINGQIDDSVSALVVAQLLFLEAEDSSKPVSIYINSPGGYVTSGLAIYDTMQYIKCDVSTVCAGQAASMGSLLLTAGAKGQRYALPNSRIMIHQPLGGFSGQVSDIEIHAREILKLRDRLNGIYSHHTGQPVQKIETSVDRDNFLSPEEAVQFGLIDKVITTHDDMVASNGDSNNTGS
ncbi:hypothetical protein MIR68_002902 [Amoeboaphelidium protococcarum]|nr:hypothetical protein MIR68_002902 [Amoeboaphelidium protococcarum]